MNKQEKKNTGTETAELFCSSIHKEIKQPQPIISCTSSPFCKMSIYGIYKYIFKVRCLSNTAAKKGPVSAKSAVYLNRHCSLANHCVAYKHY